MGSEVDFLELDLFFHFFKKRIIENAHYLFSSLLEVIKLVRFINYM